MKHIPILPLTLLGLTLYVAITALFAPPPALERAAAQEAYLEPTVTATAYPAPTTTPTAARTTVATTGPAATVDPTAMTPTATIESRPTFTSTPAPTLTLQPTLEFAQVAVPSPTPPSTLTCAPGQTVLITGVAPPRAPLLLYFGSRVVGGGSARPSGEFAIPLTTGSERVGMYTVTVRVRGTRQIVRALTCEVPATTPTPLARRVR